MVLLVVCVVFGITYVKADSKNSVLIIGDSRCVGMSAYDNNYKWVAKVAVGCNWVDSNLNVGSCDRNDLGTQNLVQGINDKNIKKVIYCLGVNSPSDYNKAIETIKLLSERTDCKIYFLSLTQGVSYKASKYGMHIDNNELKVFNKNVKNALPDGVKYINAYKYLDKIDNWESHTADGVHYDKFLYEKILQFIRKRIK